jgi:hypothetical protein
MTNSKQSLSVEEAAADASEVVVISVGGVQCCPLPDYRALVPIRCDQCGKKGGHHPACILNTRRKLVADARSRSPLEDNSNG